MVVIAMNQKNEDRAYGTAADEDACFLTEKEMIWGEMLADVLKQHEIPFFYKGVQGAGLAMKAGPVFERYRFYVPYAYLEKASGLVEELFPGESSAQ